MKWHSTDSDLSIPRGFSPLDKFGHKIQQMIMPILALVNKEFVPLGTGFMISTDGLMLTAKHVIEEFEKYTGQKAELYCLYVTNKKNPDATSFGGLIPIQRCWLSKELDIAFCWLNVPLIDEVALRFPVVKLSPGLPKVGENILGFGYHTRKGKITRAKLNGKSVAKYSQHTSFTTGEIKEVFSPKRDNSLLSFPCFHTNARFDAGMSGGPIFNEKGYVIGIICSSTITDSSEEFISYSSLIWPAFGISIDARTNKKSQPEKISIFDLAKQGYILTDNSIDDLAFDLQGDKVTVSIKADRT